MRAERRLAAMRSRALNYDPTGEHTPATGWRVDDLCRPLPGEPPGEPVPGGSWEIARRLMWGYEFADPSIVRAAYDPDEPLEGRTMVLELRFRGLRYHAGVRVARVYDERREHDGRTARVWGWAYRTLEGHLEQGEMEWEVWKWLDSGAVEFRIHAYSRRARDVNPVLRLGFRLFGRREQVAFLRSTQRRMLRLTEEALRGGDVHGAAEASTARPARGTARVHDVLRERVR